MQRNLELEMQVESLCIGTILKIQKILDPDEMISLVFLLDDCHEKALNNLISYQRMTKIEGYTTNILLNWALEASQKSSWKWKLVDALLTCQILSVIKNIGVDIVPLKKHLLSANRHYVHPMKKHIFTICENTNSLCYKKLFKILNEEYNLVIIDHVNCEILFLQLIQERFFTISFGNNSSDNTNFNKIVNVLEQIDELRELSTKMEHLSAINAMDRENRSFNDTRLSKYGHRWTNTKEKSKERNLSLQDFKDTYELLDQLMLDDLNLHLKADNGKE